MPGFASLRGLLVLTLMLVTHPIGIGVTGQASRERGTAVNTIAWAQRFLAALYPEAIAGNVELQLTASPKNPWDGLVPFLNMAVVRLPRGHSSSHAGTSARDVMARTYLATDLRFNQKGQLVSLSSRGTLVNVLPILDLCAKVDSEGLTEATVAKVLRDAGARFGPEEETSLLMHLHLSSYERFFGPWEMLEVRFIDWDRDFPEGGARLVWELRMKTADGRHYDVYVEPIDGRIRAIHLRE